MELDQHTLDGWVKAYPGLEDLYPATAMQLGLVFHSLLDGRREAYATQVQMDFEGGFDAETFRRAWAAMLSRHAIFRTAFVGLDREQPLQVVVKEAQLHWREEDWRALDREAQEEAFTRYRENDSGLGFDFGRAPLMRMGLVRLSERKYRWLWTHHHSLLDGWSVATVMQELFQQYEGLRIGRKVALPRRADYRDYIAWLSTQDPRAARAYWREALSGTTATPLDLPQPGSGQAEVQEEQVLVIPAPRTEALKQAAQRHGVTLSTLMQGAWAYLLHRYSGERHVLFGQTVSGRSTAEVAGIETMVGLFINTLPVPVEIPRDAAIGDWLRRLQQEQAQRESYGYLPLVEIQRLMGLQARESLFDTLLVFENYRADERLKQVGNGASPSRLQVSAARVHEGPDYGLTLVAIPTHELSLKLLYLPARFPRGTMTALLGHLGVILDGLADAGIRRVHDLPYLGKAADEQRVERSKDAAHAQPQDLCIHELFEAEVRQRPDAVALVQEGGALTYAELNQRVNRLAHRLIGRGVGPELRVGLCTGRATERVIGLLGILKAGGCPVPLDAGYPALRSSYLIEDSGIEIIVCQRGGDGAPDFERLVGDAEELQCVSLDADCAGGQSTADPVTDVDPGNLAFAIHAADHPGEWKTLIGSHRSLVNLATFQGPGPGMGVDSRVPQLASSGCDTATWHRALALLSGSALHFEPAGNVSACVLGPDGDLLPQGAAGELHLGGTELARGYLNLPGTTAQRFIPDRFSIEPGARLYRTGDLARWLPDGRLEHLGRVDDQVKVRGYRIEPGQIERVLRAHDEVRDAVVVVREDSGIERLVSYVVAESGARTHDLALIRALRRHLQEQLPGYRVPSAFVVLESLPMTANGEVDRAALPAPEASADAEYLAPEGMTEELLAQIWGRVLERERIGRNDSFFELGGHSLLATQLASRIRETFSTDLPLRELFEHPTLTSQARAIEQARGAGALPDLPVEAVSREQPLPLSFAQQRLWFLHQYMGPSAVYNIPLALRLGGEVNEAALLRTLEELCRRHESLRTRFESHAGSVAQVIDPPARELAVEAVSAAEARAITRAERAYCFDLSRERLCRIRLLRETDGGSSNYVLLLTMHHSVSDGWSLGIFFRELMCLYRACVNGEDSPLAPLPIQYADYAAWQRRWLQGAVLEQQLSYWREQLEGLPPLLTLPTDHPRPAEQTFRGSMERFAVPASLAGKLQDLSRAQGVTLYMTLLSAFAVLLGRYSGQQDVAVGTPVANRTRRETEGLIGFFLNTLVMRHDLRGDPRYVEVLQRTREMALRAYAHQDVPFEQLVEELNPERSLSHSPLFQVSFSLVNTPATDSVEIADLSAVTMEAMDGESGESEGIARYDLTLNVSLSDAGIAGTMEFNTDLFSRTTIVAMLGHYEQLLEAIVSAPRERISRYEILSGQDKHQQLRTWNATQTSYPGERCIQELFEDQVWRQPDAVAVVSEDRQLSYAELNRRANQVARCLREHGVGPDVRVGICMERSAQMAVGLLGILKAGGAYVPLDPEYPPARLQYMLTQSGCRVVLSEQHLMADLPWLSTTRVLPLDAGLHEALFGGYGDANLARTHSAVHPAHLAYVIYTSGSTGQPKGSAIVHQNISRLIHNDFLDYRSARTLLCAASPSFDAFTFEFWGALLHGGRSVMSDALRAGSVELGGLIDRQGVDCAWLTSSLFNRLIDESAKSLAGLKRLLVGGEALSIGHIRQALRQLPHTVLINGYGPTENTTFSCTYAIAEEALAGRSSVPIGRPIGNTQAYVLGPQGELVPRGVVGELYLGGAGLARGYLEQPALTAQKFVPSAFAQTPGERLYRSGDLVRYLPDGNLEFIGRVDHQVKVRGFRIELGEIESVLLAHDAVREAVVMARDEEAGSKQLVGYVVAAENTGEARELQLSLLEHLRARLPDYMVPAAFVLLDALPLTANKKVDVHALPKPDDSAYARAAYLMPETAMEKALAQLWGENLGLQKVGTGDNYFSIGGDSIRSISLVAEAKRRGLKFSVKDLFSHPTIKALAQVTEATGSGEQELPPLEPFSLLTGPEREHISRQYDLSAIEDAFPLSTLQQGLIYHSVARQDLGAYHVQELHQVRERWDAALFSKALSRVVSRHATLRTVFDLGGARPLQVVLKNPDVHLDIVHIADASESIGIVKQWIDRERQQGMDLSSCPWKARVHVLPDGEFVLAMSLHHALWDGWSNATFLNELLTTYSQYEKQGPVDESPRPPSYGHFVELEQKAAACEDNAAWWRDKLEGSRLPWWTGDLRAQSAIIFHEVSEGTSKELLRLAVTLGVQEKSVWTAIYLALVALLDGSNNVVASVATHGRPELSGGEKMLGLFVNSLPVRVDMAGKRWRDLVLAAEAELQALNAVRHYPLVEVQARTGMSFSAALFNFVNFHVYGKNITEGQLVRYGGFEETNYPLTFQVYRFQDLQRHDIYVSLDPSVFDEDFRERIRGYVAAIIECLLERGDQRIDKAALLSPVERHRQLVEWNERPPGRARDKSVRELFEEQADRNPDAIMVSDERRWLTCREVNERANAVAHCLIEQGVTPGHVVGLCVESAVERSVGLLGILKAGGAYVPLEADPTERLDYLLEDSGAGLIVTQSSVRPRLAPQGELPKLVELQADGGLPGYRSANPGVVVGASALACVRYEADQPGGAPAGRMIPHAGLLESCDGSIESLSTWLRDGSVCGETQGTARRTAYFVLNDECELLPVGVAGELYVRSEAAGWGYRHRPGITAERFVPDAFSATPGERLYRTGERARWKADGKLELVNPEPASQPLAERERYDIERALRGHETVRDAVVVALDAGTQPRRVAYVVARAPGALPAEKFIAQLKKYLRTQSRFKRLPDEWLVLEVLPRTPAGAVDRAALPQPEGAGLRYVAPRTPLERTLVEVWQARLGIERVGIEDNYFALGGDSIRSLSLVAEARQRGVHFSIKDLFAHPTVSGLAAAIEQGDVRSDIDVEAQVEPFALLTAAERGQLARRHDMTEVEDAYPLSMTQQGMVLESLRHAHLNVYLNFQIYEFKDPWDRPLFERALQHLMDKHPMLRTLHDFSGERPLQLVLKGRAPLMQVVDVRHLDPPAVETALDEWMHGEQSIGLDTTVSLWRATVHVTAGEHFVFGMCVHHALWDGWSLESFVTELYATYGLLKRGGRIEPRPRLPSYSRFIALEQAALSSPEHREYWARKLEGAAVPWWTGREKSVSPHIYCEIPEATSQRLAGLARSLGVQEKSVWCSVYLALLSLLSGNDDVVGTVMTQGRPEIPDGDKIVGVFLNGMPLRARLSGRRWVDLIEATDRELAEQHAFRRYPLAEIQRLAGLEFSAAMFNYSNWHVYYEGVDRQGTREEWVPRKIGGSADTNYLLNVFVHKDDKTSRPYVDIHADAQVFDADFRERIRGYVARIVAAIAGDARAFIDKTTLLGDAERAQQLLEWNATWLAYPRGECLHGLFEEQVKRKPDAIALVHGGCELTYRELNERANRLAHRLIESGVGPEVRVGLCLPRSAQMVIGMLGILKAGGAYVPLDPGYPRPRLQYLLEDSGVQLIVSDPVVEAVLDRGGVGAGAAGRYTYIRVSEPVEDSPGCAGNPVTAVQAANLAYVIYTSGSTGQPKGVGIAHGSAVSLLSWSAGQCSEAERDGVLASTSICFDLSIYELFLPLTQGGQCVLIDSILGLGEMAERDRVRLINTVPSAARALLEKGGLPASLRVMNLAGEPLKPELVDALLESSAGSRVYDLYGPSESTTYSTCARRGAKERESIGRPVANTQAYVLDAEGALLPGGVVGELYLGGVGLARGYLNRPGATAQKFIPNRFSSEAGERLYRTGDLARWLPEGRLEFLGRMDHQVKVRGYRIELGEIESVLRAQPGVVDAVVVAREDASGNQRLAGYVVAQDGAQMDAAARIPQLRAALHEQLPAYMVPSTLMLLDRLPLTANGKLDRKALPAPEAMACESQYLPPEGPAEELLAQLWCRLLKREQVGRHDNFFELGGHSLLAMQLVSRIRETFSTRLPLRTLFEHPTLSAQAREVEQARGAGSLTDVAIDAVSREEPLALSYAQQRLWFLHQYMGPSAVYNMSLALRLHGEVNEAALVRSLDALHRRHESLRTRFEIHDGSAVQVIDPPGLQLAVRTVPAEEVAAIARAERLYCFQLSAERLCRILLLRETTGDGGDAGDYVLLVTMHHSVSDGWSLGIFFQELVSSYQAFTKGELSPLAPLSIQYADYAQWQRRWLQGAVLAQQLSYWREQLKELPPMLTLPTDRARPAEQTFRGSVERMVLPLALTDRLQALSREQGVTLFMTLLSGWAVLLGRYSGQQQVAIGTPVANRTRRETEGLIGFFANTLVMRHVLHGDPRFVDLLEATRETALQAYAHQDIPFEQLVEALKPERSTSHSPLFQVMFILQNMPFEAIELPGLAVLPLDTRAADSEAEGTARFDLTLSVQETPSGLVGGLEYNTDLFDPGTIRRMLTHYTRLLEAVVRTPQSRLSQLEMLGDAERAQQLLEWNATWLAYPRGECLHGLFEEQVKRKPDAIALVHGGCELTYRELNERANRLAHRLIESGVGPEVRVGLCLPRSAQMVIGMLGILKAGGAYVPLDPGYPRPRLQYLLEDSGVQLIVSDPVVEAVLDRGGVGAGAAGRYTYIRVSEPVEHSPGCAGNPVTAVQAANLAYVIYTSGSTGQPKGVGIAHGSAVSLLSWSAGQCSEAERDGVLASTSICFDLSIYELFLPLTQGGQCVLIDSILGLGEMAERDRVRLINTVPSAARALLEKGGLPASLRVMNLAGEPLKPELVDALLESSAGSRVYDLYGPSESTTYSTCARRGAKERESIGRPVANTQAYVLDAEGALLPGGVVGELYLGGVGLARGYLNRPGATAQKFIPNRFSSEAGERLYRTGDLARWLPEGRLEFLGRMDHQVKVRGYRIELGEIESVLRAQPGVVDAVVVAREDASGNQRLAGYVVAQDGAQMDAAARIPQLRAALHEQLPAYMVPSTLMLLDRLPLTANGKLDRKALPAPEGDAFAHRRYEAPQGEIERALAQLWQELLRIERVGRHDNFFELGGHSLLAVTLIERMRQQGLETDVRSLFNSPTLAQLAGTIVRQGAAVVPANRIAADCERITPQLLPLLQLEQQEIDRIVERVPDGARNVQDIYPLAPLQEGILFHHLVSTGGDAYLLPMQMAFDTRERLERFLAALQRVIARHDILRTAVQWEGLSQPVQVVWRQARLAVEEVELSSSDAAQELRERFDPRRYRLDIRQAPLQKAFIGFDRPQQRWLLLLMSHHLAFDHTALEIIFAEAQAYLSGEQDRLVPPVPFREFVAQAGLGVSTAEHEEFFRAMLGDIEEPTAPFGWLDVRGDGGGIAEAQVQVDPEVASGIRRCARTAGVSAASLCHLAWAQVLARLTNRDEVVFGTVLFGRFHGAGDAARGVGLFNNTLPLRLSVDQPNASEAVRSTHQRLGQLLRHEHASLALAQRCSAVPAEMPLFTTLLNYRYANVAVTAQGHRAWEGIQGLYAEERTNYPLTLLVDDFGDGFGLTVQVREQVDPRRLCELVHKAMQLLVSALQAPVQRPTRTIDATAFIGKTALLSEVERHRQLIEWNVMAQAPRDDRCIHQLFEEQAARRPHAVALVHAGGTLSYGELNARANRIAHCLRANGAGPDTRVGICVERGLSMVVGLLAILKAGGAYVPLDPGYPRARLSYLLRDSEPVLLLVDAVGRAALVDESPPVPMLDLEADASSWTAHSSENPSAAGLHSNLLAYVIYTSGSTGRPKGVMVEHRQVVRLFATTAERFRFDDRDTWSLFHSMAFDFSVWEIWGALLHGGRLVVVPQAVVRSPLDFYELLCREGVSVLNQTPGAFTQLIGAQERSRQRHSLRQVIFGGEALQLRTLERWYARNAGHEPLLVNMYGITETCVHVTYRALQKTDAEHPAEVSPIGTRLPDLRVYLLDRDMQLVPTGMTGEIHVGGAGLARGYLNRPQLTSERFVPDPFSAEPGMRLYKSGDLGRFGADGSIEYLGRNDAQVKIRGYRIELGEIESVLLAQGRVRDAVVVARDEEGGSKRLVAYVVAEPGGQQDERALVDELRGRMQKQLPGYMVPSALMVLPSLPLTANGKVDRKALPLPGESARAQYTPPQTATEKTLAQLWCRLLKRERVARHDSFFDLGGHSLLATQLASRIQQEFEVEITVPTVFEAHILEHMAACIDREIGLRALDSDAIESLTEEEAARILKELGAGYEADRI